MLVSMICVHIYDMLNLVRMNRHINLICVYVFDIVAMFVAFCAGLFITLTTFILALIFFLVLVLPEKIVEQQDRQFIIY